MADKILAGTVLLNERHPNCKFSNEVVSLVRDAIGKRKDIAKQFGISESQIGNIRSGAQRPIITKEE
jgi:phage portal protein BeeE